MPGLGRTIEIDSHLKSFLLAPLCYSSFPSFPSVTTILPRHFEKLSSRVWGGEADLQAKDVQFLGKADGIFDRFCGFDGQAQDESAMNHYTGTMARFSKGAHFVHRYPFFNILEDLLVA